jgi:antitoxin CcdA
MRIRLEAGMSYDRDAPKRATNLSLNADLVRRARAISPKLSETVERLLAEHVERHDSGKAARIQASLEMLNAHYEEHGLAGEEFAPV